MEGRQKAQRVRVLPTHTSHLEAGGRDQKALTVSSLLTNRHHDFVCAERSLAFVTVRLALMMISSLSFCRLAVMVRVLAIAHFLSVLL